MILSITFLILAIACYAVSQLQQHGKLKWQDSEKNYFSFWGKNSWVRKYAGNHKGSAILKRIENPNWYYRFFKIKYKERWFTSTWLTVAFTDGYHLVQALFFIFLSISFFPIYGWKVTLVVYALLHVVHFVVRKVFGR